MLSEQLIKEMPEWFEYTKVFINAGTGSGKTYFIINKYIPFALSQYNCKILFLCNRTTLKTQIQADLDEMAIASKDVGLMWAVRNRVKVKTYQSIEREITDYGAEYVTRKYEEYRVAICDEAHYFFSDSTFNTHTVHSFEFVIQKFFHSPCIFMSATMDRIQSEIEKVYVQELEKNYGVPYYTNALYYRPRRICPYSLPREYDYLKVKKYSNIKQIIELIKDKEEKWMIFVPSISEGEKILTQIAEKIPNDRIGFCCANDNEIPKGYTGRRSGDIKEQIANENTFKEQVLISTAVIDNGVNIKDVKLLNLVILADNKESFLQMLGRKRVQGNEEIRLFISNQDKRFFYKRYNDAKEALQSCLAIMGMTQGQIASNILCNEKKREEYAQYMTMDFIPGKGTYYRPNYLAISQWQYLHETYKDIYENFDIEEDYFIKMQMRWLGLDENSFEEYDKLYKRKEIMRIVEDLKNEWEEPLEKDACNKFLNPYYEKLHDIDKDYEKRSSYKKLNGLLEKYKIPYCIDHRTNENRREVYYLKEVILEEI